MARPLGEDTILETIEGSRHAAPRWLVVLYFVTFAIYVGQFLITHRISAGVIAAVYLVLVLIGRLWRPVTRVDADGVRLPRLKPSTRLIPWSEIASVDRPSPYDVTVRLRRVDGTVVPLPALPISTARAIADLGGKDLLAPPPVSDTHLPSRPRPRPDESRVFELKAIALQEQRAHLAAELAKIRQTRAT